MMMEQKKAIVFPLRNAGEYIEKENEMARGKIDFTKMDNIKFIEEVAEGISKEDKNWDWQAKEICQHSLLLWWEYLRFEGTHIQEWIFNRKPFIHCTVQAAKRRREDGMGSGRREEILHLGNSGNQKARQEGGHTWQQYIHSNSRM